VIEPYTVECPGRGEIARIRCAETRESGARRACRACPIVVRCPECKGQIRLFLDPPHGAQWVCRDAECGWQGDDMNWECGKTLASDLKMHIPAARPEPEPEAPSAAPEEETVAKKTPKKRARKPRPTFKCPDCGAKVTKNGARCRSCGQNHRHGNVTAAEPAARKKSKKPVAIKAKPTPLQGKSYIVPNPGKTTLTVRVSGATPAVFGALQAVAEAVNVEVVQ